MHMHSSQYSQIFMFSREDIVGMEGCGPDHQSACSFVLAVTPHTGPTKECAACTAATAAKLLCTALRRTSPQRHTNFTLCIIMINTWMVLL